MEQLGEVVTLCVYGRHLVSIRLCLRGGVNGPTLEQSAWRFLHYNCRLQRCRTFASLRVFAEC